MNKRFLLTIITALVMSFVMMSSVMAKEKKVNYLGHEYKGEVNDQKIPAGKGRMIINGLRIVGEFDDHSVKDAKVALWDGNSVFTGKITYDESDNITLKAGGVISTMYFHTRNKGDQYLKNSTPSYTTEALEEDRIVNSSNFEPTQLKLSYVIDGDIMEDLRQIKAINMPRFSVDYTIGLTQVYDNNRKPTNVFAAYDDHSLETLKVNNYKDAEGRLWNFVYEPFIKGIENYNISVKYPDNSSFTYVMSTKDPHNASINWEIHYPDGKTIKATKPDAIHCIIDLGKFQIVCGGYNIDDGKIIDLFVEAKAKGSFYYPHGFQEVTSNIDLSKLSGKEIEKLLQDEVFPYMNKPYELILKGNIEIDGTTLHNMKIGVLKEGKFTTELERIEAEAKKEAEDKAAEQRYIAQFKKKYGFNPATISLKNVIAPGRSWSALAAWNDWCKSYGPVGSTLFAKLIRDNGSSKCYSFSLGYSNEYEGYFWIRNGKITSVTWE